MRIGIVSYDFDPPIGGLGRSVQLLVNALKQANTDDSFTIISPSPRAPKTTPWLSRLWWGKRGGCPAFSLIMSFSLPRIIRIQMINLLHVHSGSGGVFLLKRPACPLVITSHHTYWQEAEHVFAKNPIKRWWKSMMAKLEKRTYMMADRVVCVSPDTRSVLISIYGIPAHKVSVIENSIDLDTFKPGKDIVKDGNTLTYLGRLEERKGIWVLLRAFANLHRKYPALKLRLVGDNLIGNAVETYIREQGMSDAITIIGFVDDKTFLKEMQSATVVVIPSLIEGFGLIAAESMATGTCVVASASDGLKQVVSHHKTGLLFKPGDSDSCCDALEEALHSADMRKMWEQNAITEAQTRFSSSRQAQETYQCYNQLFSLSEQM